MLGCREVVPIVRLCLQALGYDALGEEGLYTVKRGGRVAVIGSSLRLACAREVGILASFILSGDHMEWEM